MSALEDWIRRDEDWWDDAACKRMKPDVFFPFAAGYKPPLPKHDLASSTLIADEHEVCEFALRVCASCFVREQCLDWALEHEEDHGIWGGRTETERRAMRRRRRMRPVEVRS